MSNKTNTPEPAERAAYEAPSLTVIGVLTELTEAAQVSGRG